jgi:hypothetical protein
MPGYQLYPDHQTRNPESLKAPGFRTPVYATLQERANRQFYCELQSAERQALSDLFDVLAKGPIILRIGKRIHQHHDTRDVSPWLVPSSRTLKIELTDLYADPQSKDSTERKKAKAIQAHLDAQVPHILRTYRSEVPELRRRHSQ